MNNTIVADSSEANAESGMEMSWEIFGLEPYLPYTASVEFFDPDSGQIVGGATRSSLIIPYYDPHLDPPVLKMVYPVGRDHEEYPSVQAEFAVIEAQTLNLANVRVGQAMVVLVNNGVAGYFGRMNHVRTTMDFPEESYRRMCPLIVPQLAVAALMTSDGKEVIGLSLLFESCPI